MSIAEIILAGFGFVVIVATLWNLRGYKRPDGSSGAPSDWTSGSGGSTGD